jgi:dipeptidase E
MKLLLTSGGVTAPAIRDRLIAFLGKPIEQSSALIIPSAAWAFPEGPDMVWKIVSGRAVSPLTDLGWRSLGVLELTALPGIDAEMWQANVRAADALLVSGGDPVYLCHWMRASGLADLIPELTDTVYVGVSAGSLVMGSRVGADFVYPGAPTTDDRMLGLVEFALFPHLDDPAMPEHASAEAERWAASLDVSSYALDDRTAIAVDEEAVEVIGDGRWRRFDR